MPRRAAQAVLPALLVGLLACETTDMSHVADFPAPPALPALAAVPDSALTRLAARVVLFGHQSVGANLLEGIREVAGRDPRVALRVTPLREVGPAPAGALLETLIGDNGQPARKTDDFLAALGSPAGQQATLALHKYCYLDFGPGTDPAAVFANYRERMAALRLARPGLLLVHVTAPLTARETGPKALVKRLLGKTTQDDLNARRAAYNALLRAEYAGKEPVFDLAAYESTGPDGVRAGVLRQGQAVPALAPAWTDDGGHLNAAGRQRIAEQLLAFLAQLP
ncbi:MAG: hypothetical protein IPI92_10345 [Gemmatimonadetes bacterium]|jgi:hypothetical protein|nr:hypothetical protein [Gemmatimonadota bacterium]MBK7785396.1 hypothetical protein [Gemmatimonadota bacterium]MBK9069171.1 hypothetical protein [Gemmatimonadota bacterium]MBK9692927.1 hypothetical protein [Gemmatimonadota bacterium]MBP9199349.1 hypothetical protein [Gemmatimonadales bacterium]